MSYGTIIVQSAATLIVDRNPNRVLLNISNNSGNDLYLGQDSTVSATTGGIKLVENGAYSTENNEQGRCWLGPIYGAAAAGTTTALYWEVNQ